jgi:hypothetical protein
MDRGRRRTIRVYDGAHCINERVARILGLLAGAGELPAGGQIVRLVR